VRVRLLLGPAGSGKTFRCLAEIRQALQRSPEGKPLVLLAPKQATYQLERQLLADPTIPGYTRLRILSFERLANFIFELTGGAAPEMLDEEGRLMVLRSLLARQRERLLVFRASARLNGFAQQLSLALRELQRHQVTPARLNELAEEMSATDGLGLKLRDLATLLQSYVDWLQTHKLHDADCLLSAAAAALAEAPGRHRPEQHQPNIDEALIADLWVDGFAEWSPQELELLAALIPQCEAATLAFCLERSGAEKFPALETWSHVRRMFETCKRRLEGLPGVEIVTESLSRVPAQNRYGKNPVLQHLEEFWVMPRPFLSKAQDEDHERVLPPEKTLRIAACVDVEAEAILATREILRHVRAGGRFRDVTVLVRKLEGYHQELQRVFSRYEIPFFLDRREAVAHHPLAELTRGALRTVAFDWRHDDWFSALKSGLVPAREEDIDRLENEALAQGWQGPVWHKTLPVGAESPLNRWLTELQPRLLQPFQSLAVKLGAGKQRPTGRQLADALREFWCELRVEEKLEQWAAAPNCDSRLPSSVHATVWEQMNAWLDNVELAFQSEELSLRDWLPVLEAGLANLSVGVIPPALDQVILGAIDRSRNPEIKLALILGLNEKVFPALSEANALLTEGDRNELEKRELSLGNNARQQLSRERYLAYIALTRARERVVLTYALRDAEGTVLTPSPFVSQLRELFPSVPVEVVAKTSGWRESEHASELVVPLLRHYCSSRVAPEPASNLASGPETNASFARLAAIPALAAVLQQVSRFEPISMDQSLTPELAARLYGGVLRTSVSRMEQFAACPFKFFVHSGLRAEERKLFELDIREQGNFQHLVLSLFHEELKRDQKRWREITPAEARERVQRIAKRLATNYRDGLLEASEQSRFTIRVLTESLMDFVETLVGWIRGQYAFDPVQVELAFGDPEGAPAWTLRLANGKALALYGRIDRVDLYRQPRSEEAFCVVVDYKSGQKQLDSVFLAHGLQLQLMAYLNVLRNWAEPRALFGAARLIPAGVFYVSLRGKYLRAQNRLDALADPGTTRKLAYRHTGRFDDRFLPKLDTRPGAMQGDQFNYRRTRANQVNRNSREALSTAKFNALVDSVETNLRKMGEQIFAGVAQVAPFRKGQVTACQQCDYRAICRIDPWTQSFRVLRDVPAEIAEPSEDTAADA
jgi:ATP-dependent helicase/nuclease subunit B